MLPPLNVCLSVNPFFIADWEVENLQIQFARTEEKIEIAERIEIAEVGSIFRDLLIIGFGQHFRSAKCILDVLSQQPTKEHPYRFVRTEIEKAHCFLVHRITSPPP